MGSPRISIHSRFPLPAIVKDAFPEDMLLMKAGSDL
jgi:hypothetical protein